MLFLRFESLPRSAEGRMPLHCGAGTISPAERCFPKAHLPQRGACDERPTLIWPAPGGQGQSRRVADCEENAHA